MGIDTLSPGEYRGAVKLYHTTDAAEAILMLDGDAPFHDDRYRLGGLTLVGVLVSDQPLDANTRGLLVDKIVIAPHPHKIDKNGRRHYTHASLGRRAGFDAAQEQRPHI
jgi:hypothetical protein